MQRSGETKLLIKNLMAKDPLYYKLIEACSQEACPVCRATTGLLDRYQDGMFYESVNDVPNRAVLRRSYGFCKRHAWRLLEGEAGNALGIAIIYHDIMTNVLRDLPAPEDGRGKQAGIGGMIARFSRQAGDIVKNALQALAPKERCPACTYLDEVSRLTTTILLNELQDEKLAEAFAASEGLCLLHLSQAIELNKDESLLALLLSFHIDKLSALNDNLAEFIRKNDYRFRHEGFGLEGNSWRKAVRAVIGERDS